jgi:SAM-dependent methyltransferase
VSPRKNLVHQTGERWRPPIFTQRSGAPALVLAAVRRYFDLQAGSIWRDLTNEIPNVRGTLLDVGCGAQPYRSLVPAGTTYLGIDSEDAKLFGYQMPDTRYYAGDVWPVDDDSVDCVLATETLEHVPDPRVFLAQARRCLRASGRLILTVPFSARWHFIPHDYWRFTPSGLRLLLEEAGFSNIAVYARGNETTVACYKAMALYLSAADFREKPWPRRLIALVAVPLLPLFIALASVANLSFRSEGGDDCLGYTVVAS